jgi:hypothetical protein
MEMIMLESHSRTKAQEEKFTNIYHSTVASTGYLIFDDIVSIIKKVNPEFAFSDREVRNTKARDAFLRLTAKKRSLRHYRICWKRKKFTK